MKSIEQIRQENIRRLRDLIGTGALCEKLQRSDSQVSQWVNGSKHSETGKPRHMRSSTARWIEERCALPNGWLDTDHHTTESVYELPSHATIGAAERSAIYIHQLTPDELDLVSGFRLMGPELRDFMLEAAKKAILAKKEQKAS